MGISLVKQVIRLSKMKFVQICLLISLLVLFQSAALAEPASASPATQPSDYLIVRKGDLPIILSAPHGGLMSVPGTSPRTGKNVVKKREGKTIFSTSLDARVDDVAIALADEIEHRTGKRPYLVIAKLSRAYCDPN